MTTIPPYIHYIVDIVIDPIILGYMNTFSTKVTYDLKYSLGPTKQKKSDTPGQENQCFIACLVAIVLEVLGLPYEFTLVEINRYK